MAGTAAFCIGPSYEWYRELADTWAEDPALAPALTPVTLPGVLVVAELAPPAPRRCRRCRYLKTWCACPGGARGL